MESLKKITLDDYKNLTGKFEKWLPVKHTPIPSVFWKKIKDVEKQATILDLLYKIDNELMSHYGSKRDTAKSFLDSRFSSIPQIFKRGMVSCGALSKIHCAVLRNLGVPVKLVHGRLHGQRGENRHSWLKLYNPKTKTWIPVDPTQDKRGFMLIKKARQIKIYCNWDEMKDDYRLGKF